VFIGTHKELLPRGHVYRNYRHAIVFIGIYTDFWHECFYRNLNKFTAYLNSHRFIGMMYLFHTGLLA